MELKLGFISFNRSCHGSFMTRKIDWRIKSYFQYKFCSFRKPGSFPGSFPADRRPVRFSQSLVLLPPTQTPSKAHGQCCRCNPIQGTWCPPGRPVLMSSQDTSLTGTSLGLAQLRRHEPFNVLGQEWTWHFSPSPRDIKAFAPARHRQVCLLPPSQRDPALRGSLLQDIKQEEGKYENYEPDAPFPKATVIQTGSVST